MTETTVAAAMMVIRQAMAEDPDFAHGWHCNVAMMCYDAINNADIVALDMDSGDMSHDDRVRVGNDAASRFMKLAFDVETSANPTQ